MGSPDSKLGGRRKMVQGLSLRKLQIIKVRKKGKEDLEEAASDIGGKSAE